MKSIIQTDPKCFLCQQAIGTQTHHIFGGLNRGHSEQDGLTVRLCAKCHDDVHFSPTMSGPLMKALHRLGQTQYEATGHTREEFMKRYGKNYL